MDHEAALGTVQSMLANEMEAKAHNEKRLAEYVDDYEADAQMDTAAQVKRTREKIKANIKRIEVLEYVAGVLDQDTEIERIYQTAASLFDADETVDLKNEYHRGVTELVLRLIGMDSDDIDDVASSITAHNRDLRYYASDWARTHGTFVYDGVSTDINVWGREGHGRTFSEDELNTILILLEGAKIVL